MEKEGEEIMEELLDGLYTAVLNGDASGAVENVTAALNAGAAPEAILQESMIPAMMEVGRLFELGEAFVPEMLIAARAMQSGLQILRPHLIAADVEPVGKVVLGTVSGDMHDIGKNLVGMMLEGAGYATVDLGVNVSPQAFVDAVEKEGDVDLVCMSALLTTTMPQMRATIDAFKHAEIYDDVKIMVGGAPVTPEFAEAIGAHGSADDAGQAVKVAQRLTGLAA